MKLCYMYDDTFLPLKNHFLNNLKDDFELIELKLPTPKFSKNPDPVEVFGGGIDVWLEKPKYLLRTLELCQPGEYFIYSDVDVLFFKPVIPKLMWEVLGEHDVLFLREVPSGLSPHQGGVSVAGNCNFGFCIIKACEQSKQFFLNALKLIEQTRLMDQIIVNKMLYSHINYNLNWGLLPLEFTTTNFIPQNRIDTNSLMYHAICCIEPQDKFNMMAYAQSIVSKSKSLQIVS